MANLDLGVAITPQSVFRTGSLSKQFTAGAVIMLALDGTIALDADVRDYLTELPAYARPMTVRQFVNHTSGVRDYLTLMYLAGKRDEDFYTNEEVLEMVARQQEPNFLPGDEFLYSNSGYFLLGEIVRRASGASLRRFSHDRIFQPLGMSHTHFHDDHTETVAQRASGYAQRDDGTWRIDMTTLDMVGDGGVFTSIEDLVLWERQLLAPRVGGAPWLAEMLRPGVLTNGDTLDYAGGLRVTTYRGLRTVDHGGAFVGFRSHGLRFPDQRAAIYVLCNFAEAQPGGYARAVADLILADQFAAPRAGDPGPAAADDADPPSVALGARRVQEIVGTFYSAELDVEYAIAPHAGGLRLTVGPRTVGLRAVSDTTLNAAGGFVTLRLPRGRVDRFLLDAGRVKNLRFERR
jgi:CubicO group peptidase (beta-lactamase class C family)